MIVVESIKTRQEELQRKYSNAILCDVTDKSPYLGLKQLSPFYPWDEIPVSFSPGVYARSVAAVWDGLKVFENADVDIKTFSNYNRRNIIHENQYYGKILGHRKGIYGETLLNYQDAREKIYIPTYKWMLEHKAYKSIIKIRDFCQKQPEKTLILLDYQTNCDIYNIREPLSHAFLIKAYVEGIHPYEDVILREVQHHIYCGRKIIQWITYKTHFKELPLEETHDAQLKFDFD